MQTVTVTIKNADLNHVNYGSAVDVAVARALNLDVEQVDATDGDIHIFDYSDFGDDIDFTFPVSQRVGEMFDAIESMQREPKFVRNQFHMKTFSFPLRISKAAQKVIETMQARRGK